MKRKTKLLPLGMAVTMFLSSMTAMALPNNTIVLGSKAFSINALMKNVPGIQQALNLANGNYFLSIDGVKGGSFFNLFNTNETMTDAQKTAIGSMTYTDYDDATNQFTTTNYSNFDTISNTPATNVPAATVAPTATPTATPTPTPVAVRAGVEKVEFSNYRNVKVTFNTIVDKASAEDASNYYFEIVDGNAGYGVTPTLGFTNQLSAIQTDYPGGADIWWHNNNPIAPVDHIVASTVNGKTVVNIYLPEDARFTSVFDDNQFETIADTERTLAVLQYTSRTTTSTGIVKYLTKDTVVNVAVRNVKDANGNLSIDTVVKPINILDEAKPSLNEVAKVSANGAVEVKLADQGQGLGENLGNFALLRTLGTIGQQPDSLRFKYSEPVFDAHDLDKSDLESIRNIKLYVNGNLIADTLNTRGGPEGELANYLTFNMANNTYEQARNVTFNAQAALNELCKPWSAGGDFGELFSVNKDYEVRIVGVTDLAGNIEVSSQHFFNVRLVDSNVVNPTIPEVRDIVQVADNVLRVEFNRAGAVATLKIKDPDGEGLGELSRAVPASVLSSDGKYYSYISVPARDNEVNGSVPTGFTQNQVLAYDLQDEILRRVSVEEVKATDINGNLYFGNSYFKNSMSLKDDIKAPVASNPETIKYTSLAGTCTISVPVADLTPWINDVNVSRWVSPIKFVYNGTQQIFTNEAMNNQIAPVDGSETYLPMKVSYVDSIGATHQAMVTNRDMRTGTSIVSQLLNPGVLGSIAWNSAAQKLELDLGGYPELLDADGKLVAGATYKVELPAGYFTDAPNDVSLFGPGKEFTFGGYNVKILNVDDARQDRDIKWDTSFFAPRGLGFTSIAKTLTVNVEPKPALDPQLVPQTSKQLINYDEASKSMKIEFTGNINVNTLTDKNNYLFNGKTLAQWDTLLGTNTEVKYVVDNSIPADVRQFAVFVVPQDSITQDGDYNFRVSGLRHPNGGTMTPVETVVGLRDNSRPVVIEALRTGDQTIRLTFNEKIKYFVDSAVSADQASAARNFKVVVGGQVWTVTSAVLPVNGFGVGPNGREVVLHLGNSLTTMPDTAEIKVQIVKDQNDNILIIDESVDKNAMKLATYNVTR